RVRHAEDLRPLEGQRLLPPVERGVVRRLLPQAGENRRQRRVPVRELVEDHLAPVVRTLRARGGAGAPHPDNRNRHRLAPPSRCDAMKASRSCCFRVTARPPVRRLLISPRGASDSRFRAFTGTPQSFSCCRVRWAVSWIRYGVETGRPSCWDSATI